MLLINFSFFLNYVEFERATGKHIYPYFCSSASQMQNYLCYTQAVTGGSVIFLYYVISVNLQHFPFY